MDCIEKATKKVKKKPFFKDIDFEIQEGITGESGAVPVAAKIADERIPNADIFIADLSVVNSLARLPSFLLRLLRVKYKPFQNNNVIYEYGVAYESLGVEKIIGLLNSAYGSPKDNPSNIPFDIAHLRFPIEYNYSSKTSDKAILKEKLVNELATAIETAAIFAITNRKNRYRPFMVWPDWERSFSKNQKFFSNAKTEEVKSTVLKTLDTGGSVRLLGLSGLGKTRILMETFRINPIVESSIHNNGRVLYYNYSLNPQTDLHSLLGNIVEKEGGEIIIIDNCPKQTHRELLAIIRRSDAKFNLITIDSNPEEIEYDRISGVNYISIRKEDLKSIVEDILKEDFHGLPDESIEKIKEFSQGIPLMAVLLGESIKNGERFIGKLDDKELLDKLLGEKGQDNRARTILKTCAIFNYFGYEEELRPQLEFIATEKALTSLNGDMKVIVQEFEEVCGHYLNREIFEKRGRLLGMRPFPLAISLAQEWLENCSSARLLEVIASITSQKEEISTPLTNSLSEQMKYLGYNEKAQTIIDKTLAPGSPFDDAEVLNTELGSRLFRAFVEVNPLAVAENLSRNLSSKTEQELLMFKNGRRNMVWVLEKLCFDKRTFSKTIPVLYSFAIAENESWANNATGLLLGLFKIVLAGTEVNLDERYKVLEWALSQANPKYIELALKAMDSALTFQGFSREIGAEYQGNKKLKDYDPTKDEIMEYWRNILELLKQLYYHSEYSSRVCEILENSLRSVCRANLADLIVPILFEIVESRKNDWEAMRRVLKTVIKYDSAFLSHDQKQKINILIESLTKTDFKSKYESLPEAFPFGGREESSRIEFENTLNELAKDFLSPQNSVNEYLEFLYSNHLFFVGEFAAKVLGLIKNNTGTIDDITKKSIETIKRVPEDRRHINFFTSFISKLEPEQKKEIIGKLIQDRDLRHLLFPILSLDKFQAADIDILFDIVDRNEVDVSAFLQLSGESILREFSRQELTKFSGRVFSYGEVGYQTVFELFFHPWYLSNERNHFVNEIFKTSIKNLMKKQNEYQIIDDYKWNKAIEIILSNEKDETFAVYILNSIAEQASYVTNYRFDIGVQGVFEVLIKKHFSDIWPVLSKLLVAQKDDYMKYYGLKNILESQIGGVGRKVGLIFEGDIEKIFIWCHENQPLAPSRLAELVPIFGGDNNNFEEWHPYTQRLIDEFGHLKEVLSSLSATMGTFSWVGSIVPLLEAKKKLFEQTKDHKHANVREWAISNINYLDREIKREKIRDEESFL